MSESVAAAIGRLIAKEREAQGMHPRDLARAAGCSAQSVTYWEIGDRNITARQLLAVAAALRVPITALVPDGDRASPDTYRASWDACLHAVRQRLDGLGTEAP